MGYDISFISGGQSGIDTLGVTIGKKLGIKTGGTAAPKFATEFGNNYDLKDFDLVEISPEIQKKAKTSNEFWLPRTEENVKNSDGTVYFSNTTFSPGMNATERYAKLHNKPFIINPLTNELIAWIIKHNIKILNIAGNRKSKCTSEFLLNVEKVLEETINELLNKY